MDFRGKGQEPEHRPLAAEAPPDAEWLLQGHSLISSKRPCFVSWRFAWNADGGEDKAERRGCLAPGPVLGDGGHGVWLLPSLSKEGVQSEAVRIGQSPGRIPCFPWATPPVYMQRLLCSLYSLIKVPYDGSWEPCSSHDLILWDAQSSIKYKSTEWQMFYREVSRELPQEGCLKCFCSLIIKKDFKKFIFKTVIQYLQQYLMCTAFTYFLFYSLPLFLLVITQQVHNSLVSHLYTC